MKKLLALSLALSMGAALFSLDVFSYVPVSGNVTDYTQTDYAISSKFGNFFRTPELKTVHILDSRGRDAEVSELTARDALTSRTSFTYDASGNLTEQTNYNADSSVVWKNVITYTNGKRADFSEYGKDGSLKSRTIYTYADGNLVDETGYNGEGALIWKIIYKYGDNGKQETVSEYSADGILDNERTFTYTAEGKIDTISTFDNYTRETEQAVFRYAANNTLSEVTIYDNDKQIKTRILIKYDNAGNIARVSEYNIAQKFGTTVNELVSMSEVVYTYSGAASTLPSTLIAPYAADAK